MEQTLKKVRKELEKTGLLLLSDNALPSLVSLVTGEAIKGSWWGHPKGNLIYNLSGELEEQTDVLVVKLINKKVTFVHQRHWDALIAIGTSESEWQFKKMVTDSQYLFDLVQEKGMIETQRGNQKKTATELGKIANKLEEKLLIYSESIHTDSGKHARVLRTWQNLAKSKNHKPKKVSYQAAITQIELATAQLTNRSNGIAKLPWQ